MITAAFVLAVAVASHLGDDLYGHRLLFSDDGAPLVAVGLMQGRQRVVVVPNGEATLVVDDKPVPVTAAVVIERKSGTPAKLRSAFVVDTLEGAARLKKKQRVAELAASGFVAESLDVGGMYGVKGTVVDTRAALILVNAQPGTERDVEKALLAANFRPVLQTFLVQQPAVQLRVNGKSATSVLVRAGQGRLTVKDVEHDVGYAEHGFADRDVRGDVAIVSDKQGLLAVVNIVDEDAVIGGVLPSEMFAKAPHEALKAQAVTARGELFSKVNRRHFEDPFVVCSEQHCQVYKGITAEDPRTNQAVRDTRGELALVDGRLVESVYSACCGGHTEAADAVWDRPAHSALGGTPDAPAAASSIKPVEHSALFGAVPPTIQTDAEVRRLLELPRTATYCGRSTFNQKGDAYRWRRRFTRAELTTAFADLDVGQVHEVRVDGRGPGGRVRAIVVTGDKGTARVLRELPVRKRLNNLRSGLFVIEQERDASGQLQALTFVGGGFGHGSGMCQQGAIGMAEAGARYDEILAHYYKGAVVKRVF